jgi:hypothetical protein
LFKYILQYLRDGHINVPDAFRSDDMKALRCEAEYYGLDGLLDELTSAEGLVPALQEGSPMLRCARVVYGVEATKAWYSQSWSRPMCKYDVGVKYGTLLSGVMVVPSTSKGKFCYAITQEPLGKCLSGHDFDHKDEDDIISILHADVNWANAREDIEKRLAKITSGVVQQLDWQPLVVPEGGTTAEALTNMLSLRCNGADKCLQPSAFEYSWSIVHVQPEGAETGQLVGGAIFENCIEEAPRDEDDDVYDDIIKFKPYQYCEAIAAQVERYWQRAAAAFMTYAPAHSDGPGVSGVRSASDDTDDVSDGDAEGDSSGADSDGSNSTTRARAAATSKKSKKKRARTTRA